jgi:hypothetical protein
MHNPKEELDSSIGVIRRGDSRRVVRSCETLTELFPRDSR